MVPEGIPYTKVGFPRVPVISGMKSTQSILIVLNNVRKKKYKLEYLKSKILNF